MGNVIIVTAWPAAFIFFSNLFFILEIWLRKKKFIRPGLPAEGIRLDEVGLSPGSDSC